MVDDAVPWRPALFKGAPVFARCSAAGELESGDGRIEVRYRLGDLHSYRASARNVELVAGAEVLPDQVEQVTASGRRRRATLPQRRGARASAEFVVVYTDGACSGNPGPAGVGVVILRGGRVRELSHYLGSATNNVAELTAIEMALAEIGEVSTPVRIYTDSQYAIGVLTKDWKAKVNRELVERIRAQLTKLSDVEFTYVPGHAGVALNERADQLAVLAVSDRHSSAWHDGEWPG